MLVIKVFAKKFQRTGTKKDGSEFKVLYQEAEMLREGKRPRVIEVSSPRDGSYQEGLYTLDASSFRPDMYDRMALSPYPKLQPLNDAVDYAVKLEAESSSKAVKK